MKVCCESNVCLLFLRVSLNLNGRFIGDLILNKFSRLDKIGRSKIRDQSTRIGTNEFLKIEILG